MSQELYEHLRQVLMKEMQEYLTRHGLEDNPSNRLAYLSEHVWTGVTTSIDAGQSILESVILDEIRRTKFKIITEPIV